MISFLQCFFYSQFFYSQEGYDFVLRIWRMYLTWLTMIAHYFKWYELHYYLLSGIFSDTLFFTLLIICIWNLVPNVMLCTCLHCKSYLLSFFSTQFIRCGVITDMQLEKKFEFSRQKSLCELKFKSRKVRNLILLHGAEWLC